MKQWIIFPTPNFWNLSIFFLNIFSHNIYLLFVGNYISKYEEAGFQGVWFASAFKGASGIDQAWTPITHHLKNHLQWQQVITSMPQYKSVKFHGIALTGWQR